MNCKVRELFMFDLISKFRGNVDAKLWASCSAANIHPITESATRLLASVPPTFGSCAMLSSAWATLLRERYNIPAVVVAGDLVLDGVPVFVSSQNLPDGKSSGLQDFGEWNGHCWINVGGKIGDISLFRSAYAVSPTHHLAKFVRSNFGCGRGAIFSSVSDLEDSNMHYLPKYVLADEQVKGLWAGLGYLNRKSK